MKELIGIIIWFANFDKVAIINVFMVIFLFMVICQSKDKSWKLRWANNISLESVH